VFAVFLFFNCENAAAQSNETKKDIAVVEVGGAFGESITEGAASFGGDLAVEFTPIEHWLEIETGVSGLFNRHTKEWDTDPLVKKTMGAVPRPSNLWPALDRYGFIPTSGV
jgi:hypothetical protein